MMTNSTYSASDAPTVFVIGAGLAGLRTARLLHAAGVRVRVLEARDRPGGRILTVGPDGLPADEGFDLGPSWFWPTMQPAIGALVEELGVSSFLQASEGDVIFERMSREGPVRLPGVRQEPRSFRIAGGSAALVARLAADLPGGAVSYGVRVARMALSGSGVDLTVLDDVGAEDNLRADHVVAALPPRLLEASVAFAPALDPATARRWRETPTWMASHAKVFALYDRPFWRDAGLSGTAQSMVGPLVEIHDASTASGKAALFGFLGVGADQREAIGDASLIEASLRQFARVFGPEALRPSATLIKDWASDPLTATPFDRISSGHPVPGTADWVSGPWAERLILAGSETGPVEPGYLAGAVVAAGRAAADVIARVRGRTTATTA